MSRITGMNQITELVRVRDLAPMLRATLLESPAWTRLEPQPTSGDPSPGIEAKLHDPLWMLARQWQLAEFEGEDSGTPLVVSVRTRTRRTSAWRAGGVGGDRPARAIDDDKPLDPLIEREPTRDESIKLDQRAEAGAYLVELLSDAGEDARAALVAACPLDVAPADDAEVPPAHTAVPDDFVLMSSSVPDGVQAAAELEAFRGGGAAPQWLEGVSAEAEAAADVWLGWYRSQVAPRFGADEEDAWIPDRFEHRFSVRVGAGDGQMVLHASGHQGGEIDWYSFDHVPGSQLRVAGEGAQGDADERTTMTMLASPLRFAGMPSDRYWQFEDGQVNLGRLDVQPHDLARLCVAEFALIYGNDWLVVPLTVRAGALTEVEEVSYTTTFGERFVVREADDRNRNGRFRMFSISEQGRGDRSVDGLYIPPAALGTIEGDALEDVQFLRDEMSNLVWAVERRVQARSGESRSRGDEPRPINAVRDMDVRADYQYLLQTDVPGNWIPFVPVSAGVGSIKLRKGTLSDRDESMGVLLSQTPMDVQDGEVPREGLRVRRVPALVRDGDGGYRRWITRRASVGRGEGWSGLAFDGAYRPAAE